MGVAGAGKTTVGRAVAARLGSDFVDGDDLHTAEDVARMAAGEPLDDARRARWIERVRVTITSREDVVVACSALRRTHRDRLQSVGGVGIYFLEVPAEVLEQRLGRRAAHFFPAVLLASQLLALDPPTADEGIVTIDGDRPVAAVADEIVDDVERATPGPCNR